MKKTAFLIGLFLCASISLCFADNDFSNTYKFKTIDVIQGYLEKSKAAVADEVAHPTTGKIPNIPVPPIAPAATRGGSGDVFDPPTGQPPASDNYSKAVYFSGLAEHYLMKIQFDCAIADDADLCRGQNSRIRSAVIQREFKDALERFPSLFKNISALKRKITSARLTNLVFGFDVSAPSGDVRPYAYKIAKFLETLGQVVLEVQNTPEGPATGATTKQTIIHLNRESVNEGIMKAAEVVTVSPEGNPTDSFAALAKSAAKVATLDHFILNVEPGTFDNAGKLTSIKIWRITKSKYFELFKK